MAMDDYYELLDVDPDSDRDDIRVAYRAKRDALASQDGDQNRGKVAELNRAWNVLSDPAQRERYDERLAEHRESGESDDDEDGDDDGESPAARSRPRAKSQAPATTRAEQRAEARRARLNREPTIVVPEGYTMAATRARLTAMAFDLLVLLMLLLVVYLGGFKLIDNHFPGQRNRATDLTHQQDNVKKSVSNDQKQAAAADKAAAAAKLQKNTAAEEKARAAASAARAAQKKDTKRSDQLGAEIDKINRQLSPWIELLFLVAVLLMFLYLVPSTAISGQTLGKRIWKVRVMHVDGSRVGLGGALRRFGVPLLIGIVLAVPLRFGPLGLAIPVFGMIGWVNKPNRQGMHDRLAKTIVVEA
jgi:hypothetical protein